MRLRLCMAGVIGIGLAVQSGAQAPVVRRPSSSSAKTKPSGTATGTDGIQAPGGLGSGESDGQAPSPAGGDAVPTIRVQSRLVNVTVNVADEHGTPVGGMERGDFQVMEDGRPQTIAVFEKESATPLSVVLAIDTSETVLRDERLEKEAARQFMRALLREQDEMDLMEFSDTVREIVPFTNQERRVESGLNALQSGSETSLFDAVFLGSKRLGETRTDLGRRRVLVLITDGGDTKNKSTYRQAIEQALRSGVMVFSIIIVPVEADAGRNTGGEHALIQFADDTGGRYYYVTDPRELKTAFQKVSDDLRTQYVLGYYAPPGEAGFRKIRVKLTDPALGGKDTLRYRSGYYATGNEIVCPVAAW